MHSGHRTTTIAAIFLPILHGDMMCRWMQPQSLDYRRRTADRSCSNSAQQLHRQIIMVPEEIRKMPRPVLPTTGNILLIRATQWLRNSQNRRVYPYDQKTHILGQIYHDKKGAPS
ncbi:hypothetical protein F4823DRAFT_581126 [Ustulina deusta]|nr:hypothetical protein F4823DRAFT_581126 [Ustulina deusta]